MTSGLETKFCWLTEGMYAGIGMVWLVPQFNQSGRLPDQFPKVDDHLFIHSVN